MPSRISARRSRPGLRLAEDIFGLLALFALLFVMLAVPVTI